MSRHAANLIVATLLALGGSDVLAKDVEFPMSIINARRAYVGCIFSNANAFIPQAANLQHLVFSAFFFCFDKRYALVQELSKNGFEDPEKVATAIDERIVDLLVPKKSNLR